MNLEDRERGVRGSLSRRRGEGTRDEPLRASAWDNEGNGRHRMNFRDNLPPTIALSPSLFLLLSSLRK